MGSTHVTQDEAREIAYQLSLVGSVSRVVESSGRSHHTVYRIAQDIDRYLTDADHREIATIKELEDEEMRLAAVEKWTKVREKVLAELLDHLDEGGNVREALKDVNMANAFRNMIMSAGEIQKNEFLVRGKATDRREQTNNINVRGAVVHIPVTTPEEYDGLIQRLSDRQREKSQEVPAEVV